MRSIHRQKNNRRLIYFLIFAITIYIIYIFFNREIGSNSLNLFIDLVLFFTSFFLFLLFFSLFIIPVTETKDLMSIFYRILLFITGNHGLISNVNNGIRTDKFFVFTKNKPGLILLDSSSAAIISKFSRFHHVVGPGIVFTDKDEELVDTINLQLHKRIIGPLENENPFLDKQKYEKTDSYTSRVQRASDTKAITRDGIEVVATFIITFKVKSKPGEGNTPFGFNPLFVERAILGQSVNISSLLQDGSSKSWRSLSEILVIDVWRELIHKYKLNELFLVNTPHLKNCIENIFTRLTHPDYEEIDEFGRKTGKSVPSREYQLLEDRGIAFLEIELIKISLPTEIEDVLVNRWESSWSRISSNEQKTITHLNDQAIADGILSGKKAFAEMTIQTTNKLAEDGVLTSGNLINKMLSTYEDRSNKRSGFLDFHLKNEKKDFS
jgi:hypothetical protein